MDRRMSQCDNAGDGMRTEQSFVVERQFASRCGGST